MIRGVIQRHFFLLLSAVLVFSICFLVGFGVMQYSSDGRFFGIIHAHESYFLLWRLLVYAAVIFYWPPLINAILRKRHSHAADTQLTRTVSRQPIAIICLAFELFIVQNIVGLLLAFAFQGIAG